MLKRYIVLCILFLGVQLKAQECAEENIRAQEVVSATVDNSYADILPLKADLIQIANEWKGVRYRYGGMSKQGTDCSGFVTRVLERAMPDVKLPRSSRDMYKETLRIPLSRAKAGDLVFFRNGNALPISHVGIYLGEGYFVHATGYYGVVISHLSEDYHKKTFYAVTRITEKNIKKTLVTK